MLGGIGCRHFMGKALRALRHFEPTPTGDAFSEYCKKVATGTLTDTVDEYENMLDVAQSGDEPREKTAERQWAFYVMTKVARGEW